MCCAGEFVVDGADMPLVEWRLSVLYSSIQIATPWRALLANWLPRIRRHNRRNLTPREVRGGDGFTMAEIFADGAATDLALPPDCVGSIGIDVHDVVERHSSPLRVNDENSVRVWRGHGDGSGVAYCGR